MKKKSKASFKKVSALAKNPKAMPSAVSKSYASRTAKHFGRMNDPSVSAYLKGICGDDMEFYIVITNKIITDIQFYTQMGCEATIACGSTVAQLALGKSIDEAMSISPQKILKALNDGLPENHRHCAILAVSTFYKAIAYYLLQD
ncbi:MAG: iron-sulfur cluster assembly scaffold protein [Elusimicrobia bacterium]|nr:iron-sulfur cluster assembly scaffold protein [Elusimicrobiota bacterium]